MLQNPPQGKQWAAWLVVGIWSLVIFLTIPLARSLMEIVSRHWGRAAFTYAVLAAIAASLAVALYYVIRHRSIAWTRLVWLIATAAVFAAYTIELSRRSPEEGVHFIQYGVLGILVFRALAIKRRCIATYFSAAVICGIIGIVDEVIQWLVPQRYWGLGDVWINFLAGALVQVAIARGLNPAYLANRPAWNNIRFLCRLLAIAAALMGICLINTPARIAWYAERIPWLGYLKENESVMAEYGYRYMDPDIGIFRSRLAPEELEKADRQRSSEAGAILNTYRSRAAYNEFLKIYTPVSDPFVHEARVHLFSRDINFSRAVEDGENSNRYAERLTAAYRENQIVEKYFPDTLRASGYEWPPSLRASVEKHLLRDKPFVSWVSRHLITRFTESQVAAFLAATVLGLMILNRYLKRLENRE